MRTGTLNWIGLGGLFATGLLAIHPATQVSGSATADVHVRELYGGGWITETVLEDGTLHGLCCSYREDGSILQQCLYERGVPTEIVEYSPSGQIEARTTTSFFGTTSRVSFVESVTSPTLVTSR
ncbi:toxin-antitoxin system YwqK family antitoxin [Planctomicrobium piriforme]|uniref:MORN repeat variant n=1 Tax=Planctomicrobium piriforme TaxID=1576369 RepID=A0A1I3M4V2_9PLAN|nr:hypothetical protein [Planctomicrobium piriforme]SFI91947.1 hypothetical protein SAMN05421753_113157 [Planctomicrobium piriforme]